MVYQSANQCIPYQDNFDAYYISFNGVSSGVSHICDGALQP